MKSLYILWTCSCGLLARNNGILYNPTAKNLQYIYLNELLISNTETIVMKKEKKPIRFKNKIMLTILFHETNEIPI